MVEYFYTYRHVILIVAGLVALIALLLCVRKLFNVLLHGNIFSLLPAAVNLCICGVLVWLWYNPPESFMRYKQENTTKEVVRKITHKKAKVFHPLNLFGKEHKLNAKRDVPVLVTKSGKRVHVPYKKLEWVQKTYSKGDVIYVFRGELVTNPDLFFKRLL